MSLSVLLALAAAVCFGVSDYVSGILSRRLRILDILGVGGLLGLVLLLLLLPAFPGATTTPDDLLWGALAGACAALGVLLLLRGFRMGRFGVVSPVSAVGSAGIPVIVGLALGEQPSALVLTGLIAGIGAIWLVSSVESTGPVRNWRFAAGLWEGLGGGVLFAGMFLTLSRADYGSGPWPVLALQLGMLVMIGLALALRRQWPLVSWHALPGVATVGVTALLGTLGFIYAAHLGLVSIAAVITSMSPAVTVLMARLLIAEAFTRRQLVGLALAVLAIVLISLG